MSLSKNNDQSREDKQKLAKEANEKKEGVNPIGDKTAQTVGAELQGGPDGPKVEVVQGVDVRTGKQSDDAETQEQKLNAIDLNPGPSNPTIVRSADDHAAPESASHKAERADKAVEEGSIDREGEKGPVWKASSGKVAMVMTNVDNEKLMVTPKQWDKYGSTLMANGWVKPAWAENDGGSETIPADVDWGKDSA